MGCERGESCECNRLQQRYCKSFIPERGSKYLKCTRFITARVTCDLPKTACKECPFHIALVPRKEPKIDWQDKLAVRDHRSEYMREYRKKKKQAKLGQQDQDNSLTDSQL